MIESLLHEAFYPLGFSLAIETNSQPVLEAARLEWSSWPQLPTPNSPLPALNIHVTADSTTRPPASTFQARDHLFAIVSDSANFGVGDTRTGVASAWLTSAAVEDPAWLQYHFLDALAFQLITSAHLTPIHASCVSRNGHATLLAGDSHAGKSSLAYACARRGWTYLSDDSCPLLRRAAADRVVLGTPHSLRLRPDGPNLFPELAEFKPTLRGNGKLVLQIPTSSLPIATAPTARAVRFILLDRRAGPPRLTRVHEFRARELCAQHFYHWDPPVAAEQFAALDEMLKRVEVLELEYSNLEEAVDLLEK